jgi:hypothetical protein
MLNSFQHPCANMDVRHIVEGRAWTLKKVQGDEGCWAGKEPMQVAAK